jgi:uncharacterized protein (TIGR00255 family)
MIRSMTGYGVSEKTSGSLRVKVEIKSLNGKFLEFNLRCPKVLNSKELELRNLLSTKIERGTVQCYINLYFSDSSHQEIKVNRQLADSYHQKIQPIAQKMGATGSDVFRWVMDIPEIMEVEETEITDDEWNLIVTTAEEAFERFDSFRHQEGLTIKEKLHEHCAGIGTQIPNIEQFEEERANNVRTRLQNSLKDIAVEDNVDTNRFEQELIYYLEKYDIAEEKNRLIAHCMHFEETLVGEAKGKKLGFIAQEMGREINTLGSKANHAGIQRIVISMKEELEKIKEQVLNAV